MSDSNIDGPNVSPSTISVVVPTYNSEVVIGNCLKSIRAQTLAPHEIIVSDGGSTDGTVDIAASYGAIVIQMGANRSAQRNAAAEKATGDYVLFIDSDMRLHENVLSECVASMGDDVAALVIPEVFVGEGFWAKVRGFERSFYDNVWYLEAARLYRRKQVMKLGGFDGRLIGPEDWDLDERIRSFGTVKRTTSPIFHYEGEASLAVLLRKKAHYSNSFSLFREFHPERAELSLSSRMRVALLLARPLRFVGHPLLALGLAIMGTAEIMIARGWVGKRLRSFNSQEKRFE